MGMSHPCIEVVSYCPSVLCTSNPAGAGGAHFADILGWSSQTLACLVGAGDGVHHIGVFASDAVLDGPCLPGSHKELENIANNGLWIVYTVTGMGWDGWD